MLILTRGRGQSIMIGEDIEITLVSVEKDKVRIGIDAPQDVVILRKELCEQTEQENKKAASSDISTLDKVQQIFEKR